jgi:virginiamycin A acetyltransferase
MRLVAKKLLSLVFLVFAFPFAILAGFGRWKPLYILCAHILALSPGMPGDYMRRGFYILTLKRFSFENRIGFGSFFAHPNADVAPRAAIGDYCVVGTATIGERAIIASGVQILSGFRQHTRDAEGRLTGEGVYEMVHIGADAWIGAGSIVMASVGERATVAAGSVIFREVAADASVAGNPARVVDQRPRPAAV